MNKYEIHVSHFCCMEYSEGELKMDAEINFGEDYFEWKIVLRIKS